MRYLLIASFAFCAIAVAGVMLTSDRALLKSASESAESAVLTDSGKKTFTLEAVQRHDLNAAFMDLGFQPHHYEQWNMIVADGVGRDVTNVRAKRSDIPGGYAYFDIAAEVTNAHGAKLVREAFLSADNKCEYIQERRRIECFLGWEPWQTLFEQTAQFVVRHPWQKPVSYDSTSDVPWATCYTIMHPVLDHWTHERFIAREIYTFEVVFCGKDIVSQMGTVYETEHAMRDVEGVERLLVNFVNSEHGKSVRFYGLAIGKKAALAIYHALSDVRKSGFKCKSEPGLSECSLGNDWSSFEDKTEVQKLGNRLSPRTPVIDVDFDSWHSPSEVTDQQDGIENQK